VSKILLSVVAVLLSCLAYLVWPTPYRYFVLPSTPPNSSNEFDSGVNATLVRMNRFTGRLWVLRPNLGWFNPQEYKELRTTARAEITERCQRAAAAGAYKHPRDLRIVELKGYTFGCE
jgi:hypothetical protein